MAVGPKRHVSWLMCWLGCSVLTQIKTEMPVAPVSRRMLREVIVQRDAELRSHSAAASGSVLAAAMPRRAALVWPVKLVRRKGVDTTLCERRASAVVFRLFVLTSGALLAVPAYDQLRPGPVGL